MTSRIALAILFLTLEKKNSRSFMRFRVVTDDNSSSFDVCFDKAPSTYLVVCKYSSYE